MNKHETIAQGKRRIPALPRWWRWLVIVCGLVVLGWMSLEDDHVLTATLLGASLAIMVILQAVWGRFSGRTMHVMWLPLTGIALGGLVGISATVFTALLMLFKNAWHAHIFPDFPLDLISAILARMPVWGIAGALIGFGMALGWIVLGDDAP